MITEKINRPLPMFILIVLSLLGNFFHFVIKASQKAELTVHTSTTMRFVAGGIALIAALTLVLAVMDYVELQKSLANKNKK